MNLEGADKLLSTYLSENWATTPISWPNVEGRDFSEAGNPLLPMGDKDYIAVRTESFGSTAVTVPLRCIRTSGQMFIAVCVKEGGGQRTALRHVDTLKALLEYRVITDAGTGENMRMQGTSGPAAYMAPDGWFVQEFSVFYQWERFTG